MAEKRGTCSSCNMIHDPSLPCPPDIYQRSNEKPSKNFKKEVIEANKRLIILALVFFAVVVIFYLSVR